MRKVFAVALWVLLTWTAWAQDGGQVVLHVTLDGTPVDAKVLVRQGATLVGTFYNAPLEPGVVRMSLAPGAYTLVVDRAAGFHRPAQILSVNVSAGRLTEVSVELPRGFSPAQAWGYYCADPHAHSNASEDGITPPDALVAVLMAAELDIGFLTDHNTTAAHPAFAATAAARNYPVVLGMEITAIRWHWNAFPLTNYKPEIPPLVMLGVAPPTPTFAHARAHGAQLIMANHPFSTYPYFETLGKPYFDPNFDLVEVMNGPMDEDDERTLQVLFGFWNEGRRYVAVASSDDHDWKDHRDVYGWPRTYVYVEGELTVDKWLQALGQGRAFLTSGPLVHFTAQGGRFRPGDTVVLPAGQAVQFEAQLLVVPREQPRTLSLVRVIRNGQVIQEFTFTEETEAWVQFADAPQGRAWYILWVVSSDGENALTNPIWVEVQ